MRLSRQNKILEIIKTNDVETQDQLLSLLRDAGYSVTQATVSRDIRELQLVKGQGKTAGTDILQAITRTVRSRTVSSRYSERPFFHMRALRTL